MWAGIPHLFCGGQVHFVDVEVNQPCGGEAIIRPTSNETDDADMVFDAVIVVVKKRSVIPTFLSTTTYAAIPYFGT